MEIHKITEKDREEYNSIVAHPLQSFEWGEYRRKTGIKVIIRGFTKNNKLFNGFSLTIHKIPYTPWSVGYLPKGNLPDKDLINALKFIGHKEKCIFIQLEPNIRKKTLGHHVISRDLKPAVHPLFTKYTFILDLSLSEEELLKRMHSKTRYNIKVAQRHGVTVIEDNSDKAFEEYWRLMEETTKRQGFYAHTKTYHKMQLETFRYEKKYKNSLSSHLFLAKSDDVVLAAWILFVFKDGLYYPYGASCSMHREKMASSLMMWEAIKFGKKMNLKLFDMWGALGPKPDIKDAWYGFHNFKEKYGPEHVEFIGSYDLIINPLLYQGWKLADKLRWAYLRFRKR